LKKDVETDTHQRVRVWRIQTLTFPFSCRPTVRMTTRISRATFATMTRSVFVTA